MPMQYGVLILHACVQVCILHLDGNAGRQGLPLHKAKQLTNQQQHAHETGTNRLCCTDSAVQAQRKQLNRCFKVTHKNQCINTKLCTPSQSKEHVVCDIGRMKSTACHTNKVCMLSHERKMHELKFCDMNPHKCIALKSKTPEHAKPYSQLAANVQELLAG